MLLPQSIEHLRSHVHPMVMTDVARAVAAATRQFLGGHGGITGLLTTETAWVDEFATFALIVQGVDPRRLSALEARAVAGRTWAMYVPGTGALVNGARLAHRTQASMGPALTDDGIAGRTCLHLAHEVAGHAYMAGNTPLGLTQAARENWRQAVAFAGRALPGLEREAADRTVLDLSRQTVIVAEGWARWVTRKLRALLADALPRAGATILREQPNQAPEHADDEARQMLDDLLDAPGELCDSVVRQHTPATPQALGLALFERLEVLGGPEACIRALRTVCAGGAGERPDVALMAAVVAAGTRR